eukprot:3896849-Pyramimonas_sp.AAC.1
MPQRQELVNQAHAAWLRTARQDFGAIVGVEAPGMQHWGGALTFEDMPLDKALATPKSPRRRASAGMRWLAGQLRQLAGRLGEVLRGDKRARADVLANAGRLRAGLARGGQFEYHFARQPCWAEWEALLEHIAGAVQAGCHAWVGTGTAEVPRPTFELPGLARDTPRQVQDFPENSQTSLPVSGAAQDAAAPPLPAADFSSDLRQ